ncbi:Vigilin 1 [Sphaceloma murrayae]|uniref:Vigilin 1 n=1 Tax=Sphaceloma murrayae TaxID=2082308 RepID=A0A2K1QVQ4_9PEZI|nr:Vigilin 1 [Sphaceloma murrayae]
MHLTSFILLASAVTGHVITERADNPYREKAYKAINKLQSFYNTPSPTPWSPGWWNSAQCLTLIADLRKQDNSAFMKKLTDNYAGVFDTVERDQAKDSNGALDYTAWFDDRLWWTIALIKTYDVTGQQKYIQSARRTFQRVAADTSRAPCGLLYNAYERVGRHSSAITTLLYIEAAALLAKRTPTQQKNYMDKARKQWAEVKNLILVDGYIQGDVLSQQSDGTCTNNYAHLTYQEGVAMAALVAMADVTGNQDLLNTAETIASKVLSGEHGFVVNGVAKEYCDDDFSCGGDVAQFKGILQRGVYTLWKVRPNAANGTIPDYLKFNADSIWNNNRGSGGLLGLNWSGPFKRPDGVDLQLATHSSATMALVYASLV